MFNLGKMYIQEDLPKVDGVDHDVRAIFWFIVAAKLGSAAAKKLLKDTFGIDIDSDLNDYENVPVSEIEAFLTFFETQPSIGIHQLATFFTPQEMAAALEGMPADAHIAAATGVSTYSPGFAAAAATHAAPAHAPQNTTHGVAAAADAHDPSLALAGLHHAAGVDGEECG